MTDQGEPRSTQTIRLGVVGHRDLDGVDRASLTATVTRFLGLLRNAVDRSRSEPHLPSASDADDGDAPTFVMVNALAEGADQLVAEAAANGGFGYRFHCPIPFTANEYKSYFTYDREASVATFDRLVADPDTDAVVIELGRPTLDGDRSTGYKAAASVLLDESDLVLALHDPSRPGSRGGTAETINKAACAGMSVIAIDIRSPKELDVLSANVGTTTTREPLTNERLDEVVSDILLAPRRAMEANA